MTSILNADNENLKRKRKETYCFFDDGPTLICCVCKKNVDGVGNLCTECNSLALDMVDCGEKQRQQNPILITTTTKEKFTCPVCGVRDVYELVQNPQYSRNVVCQHPKVCSNCIRYAVGVLPTHIHGHSFRCEVVLKNQEKDFHFAFEHRDVLGDAVFSNLECFLSKFCLESLFNKEQTDHVLKHVKFSGNIDVMSINECAHRKNYYKMTDPHQIRQCWFDDTPEAFGKMAVYSPNIWSKKMKVSYDGDAYFHRNAHMWVFWNSAMLFFQHLLIVSKSDKLEKLQCGAADLRDLRGLCSRAYFILSYGRAHGILK